MSVPKVRTGSSGLSGADVVLSVVVLWNFVVAQPILDIIGQNPEFFTARYAPRIDVVAFALALTLGVPLMLALAIRGLWAINQRVGAAAHAATLVGLLMTLVVQVAPRVQQVLPVRQRVFAAAGLVLAGAAVWAFYRNDSLRSFVRIGVIAPAAFAGLFLFGSPVQALMTQEPGEESIEVASPAPVVMVVFDEFPVVSLMRADGTVDADLYPNFARLADDGTWFRNTITNDAFTSRSLPSLLTGRYPPDGAEPVVADHPRNLFTALNGSYDIWAQEAVTRLCPRDVCAGGGPAGTVERWRTLSRDTAIVGGHTVLPEPLTGGLPTLEGTWVGFGQDPAEAVDWLTFVDTIEAGDGRLFYYHAMMPHFPWTHLPSGQQYADHELPPGMADDGARNFVDNAWLSAHSWQRHLLQVGMVDTMLGELLDRLEDIGVYDETLVVVTSDHGAAFQPGVPVRKAVETNYADIGYVPLFVKRPSQPAGEVVDRPVQLIDVFPTILDVLGADAPDGVEGRSAFDTGSGPERILRSPGYAHQMSPDAAELWDAVDRKHDMFGSEGGWERLFRMPPHEDLVGRDLDGLRIEAAESGATLHVDDPERYSDVDPDAAFVPNLVSGRLVTEEGASDPHQLAVAVNGRVEATAETFDDAGHAGRLSVVLPPGVFRRGENTVEVFRIDGEGPDRVLRAVD